MFAHKICLNRDPSSPPSQAPSDSVQAFEGLLHDKGSRRKFTERHFRNFTWLLDLLLCFQCDKKHYSFDFLSIFDEKMVVPLQPPPLPVSYAQPAVTSTKEQPSKQAAGKSFTGLALVEERLIRAKRINLKTDSLGSDLGLAKNRPWLCMETSAWAEHEAVSESGTWNKINIKKMSRYKNLLTWLWLVTPTKSL